MIRFIKQCASDDDYLRCENCNAMIAGFVGDKMIPSLEECCKSGNIPIPNFGWLCSQSCATEFEQKYDVKFARNKDGMVDYYEGKL